MKWRAALLLVAVCGYNSACSDQSGRIGVEPDLESGQVGLSTDSVSVGGSFGFGNADGSELLSLDSIPDPRSVSTAICAGGRKIRVQYARRQIANPESTHRQTAANFRNEAGEVFRVVEGSAVPNETCFLASDSIFAKNAEGVRISTDAVCGQMDTEGLSRVAGRRIERCSVLGEAFGRARVIAAQFATAGTSALAAIALVGDSVILYHALPAESRDSNGSTWRVDDGGEFDPGSIRPLFAVELQRGVGMAFMWTGAEGESEALVLADSTIHSRNVVTGYRYWSPF